MQFHLHVLIFVFSDERLKKHPTPFLPLLFRHLKARALLHPFFGFNLSVPVQVGAKVPMSADAAARIVQQQRAHQHAQRMALPPCTRIGRPPFFRPIRPHSRCRWNVRCSLVYAPQSAQRGAWFLYPRSCGYKSDSRIR